MTRFAFLILAAGLVLTIFAQAEIGYPQLAANQAATSADLH